MQNIEGALTMRACSQIMMISNFRNLKRFPRSERINFFSSVRISKRIENPFDIRIFNAELLYRRVAILTFSFPFSSSVSERNVHNMGVQV